MRLGLVDLLIPRVCPICDSPRGESDVIFCTTCAFGLTRLESLRDIPTVFSYEGLGARMIQRFKYDGRRDALDFLVHALAARIADCRFDGIVPVPRHWRRVRELGSDPVYTLARALGRRTGRPVWSRALHRVAHTRSQTGLNPRQRRENVGNSFAARIPAGRRILLLDDVVTTGATLKEARKALRRASVSCRVYPVALAGTSRL